MGVESTAQALAAITDEGLFEKLATAILRAANPLYASLVHTGVNVLGKTVKSPLDNVCFVKGANPPHMIAVHHTTTSHDDLEKKWLHDPTTVKPRKGKQPTAPAGDLIKTAALVAEQRVRMPNLRATLVLTTSEEPTVSLVCTVEAAGRVQGLEIDIWSRSRLCDILDNQPSGQWIRRSFLKIEQEQLSVELFRELSAKSINIHAPHDHPDAWVPRTLDSTLTTSLARDVTFLVAASGLGKSVACFRKFNDHVRSGGLALVLPHDAVASTITIEDAVKTTLLQLHPALALPLLTPFRFCSPDRPLLLVVEDINRSGQTRLIAEKIAGWSSSPSKNSDPAPSAWRLVCPLWPESLATLGDQTRKKIEQLTITATGFRETEGCNAVLARARLNGQTVSSLQAQAFSRALGHDPLLIALHDLGVAADPNQTIGQFVEGALSRVATDTKEHTAAAYRQALQSLGAKMLETRQIDLTWQEVSKYTELCGEPLQLISRIAHHGELIHISGSSDVQRLVFRHDRVRDWLLADAAAELDRQNSLKERTIADPYFADVMGSVIACGSPRGDFVDRVACYNPLALFHALRLLGQTNTPKHTTVTSAINKWLDSPQTHGPAHDHLRWEALAQLAETDDPAVPVLASKFRDQVPSRALARVRNGDLAGGIELCVYMEPGVTAPWRDMQLDHAKVCHGPSLVKELARFLERADLNEVQRTSAVRLAGHFAEPSLAPAIEKCWQADGERQTHLDDYIWAFAECCAADPARYLGPVCDAWAALSNQPEQAGSSSPRDNLAAYGLKWAFQKWPPTAAIDYFVQRASQEELRWPITYMLNGVDHPRAVLFVVQEAAAIRRRLDGTGSFSTFVSMAADVWRRAQEDNGRQMSKVSRAALLRLWTDDANDKYLRSQAFTFWTSNQNPDDIQVLRDAKATVAIADSILQARLVRGDQQAVPALIEKLASDDHGYWWQCGRHIWSADVTGALDKFLERRGQMAKRTWCESFESDWFTSEMIMRLATADAERLLTKHWDHLRFARHFVQTALYVATPCLKDLAKGAIGECPDPTKLMEHLEMNFGLFTKGHPGLTSEEQVKALAPYLQMLSSMDIAMLWDACNRRGWFALRREILDQHLKSPHLRRVWDRDRAVSALDKMASGRQRFLLDHWLDDVLKTGVSWEEILSTMTSWVTERRSLDALSILAAAVEHCGTRDNLSALTIYEGMPEGAVHLVTDTQFAVCRRSIR